MLGEYKQTKKETKLEVAVHTMETQHNEIVGLAEAKQQACEKLQKKGSKKSQQALQRNAQCMG